MTHPTAKRPTLLITAGIVWSLVGVGLMLVALLWSITSDPLPGIIAIAVGTMAGLMIHRFGLTKLVAKNIERIYALAPEKERICVFAFQALKSYLIIIIMMVLGYTVRHLPVRRIYLSPVYLAMGLGLFLSSLRYYGSRARSLR